MIWESVEGWRLTGCGGQSQDGSREAKRRPCEGGPNLGQPGAPLTAVCSATPSPSRLTGARYNPCTFSHRERIRHQIDKELRTLATLRVSMDEPPSLGLCETSQTMKTTPLHPTQVASHLSTTATVRQQFSFWQNQIASSRKTAPRNDKNGVIARRR